MWKGLDGESFAVSGRSLRLDSSFRLTQTDVSTIISACLVAGRALGTAWQGLAAWRCIFILLEKTGLSLEDANVVGSWKLPPWSIMRSRSSSRPNGGAVKLLAILSLLLAWPAQLASPLATGSVSWVPILSYDTDSVKAISLGLASPGDGWAKYKNGLNIRRGLVQMAAGLASLKAITPLEYNKGSLNVTQARRMGTFLGSYTNGTVVQNATVPIFKIESFQWISDESQIPPTILQTLQDPKTKNLKFAEDETQMTNALGATTLLKDQPWKVPSTTALPEAIEVLSEVQYASIYVFSGGKEKEYDCHKSIGYTNNTEFGPLPPEIHLVKSRREDRSDCIAVAKLRISAGITHCNQTVPTSNSSSCFIASNIIVSTSEEVLPDNLTGEIFAMMQEVHTVVASLRMNDPETYMGRLEEALCDSLVRTYQGTWSALTEAFSPSTFPGGIGRLETRGWEPVEALRAEVSSVRILSWLAISMLFVFSGFLVLVLDAFSDGKTVSNPVIAAIMLDSSGVIEADHTGLCNAVDISKDHGNDTEPRLRLEVSNGKAETRDYKHPRLVPEETSATYLT
ncbi:hypothetical protein CCHR01_12891 [Colletotrichum chrysophilum]|uniref:Uncharacterized protein n=1 Tax=Colletotrichum chrysophilum TaxID=1836956 RepID=A0AAD9AAG7_9PEZI|nr:hypothetical protein CCHR01_12891 [Colletotrichum chrysophilum]